MHRFSEFTSKRPAQEGIAPALANPLTCDREYGTIIRLPFDRSPRPAGWVTSGLFRSSLSEGLSQSSL